MNVFNLLNRIVRLLFDFHSVDFLTSLLQWNDLFPPLLLLAAHLCWAGDHRVAWRGAEEGGDGGGGGVGVGGAGLGVGGPVVEEPGRPGVSVGGGDLLTGRLFGLVDRVRVGGTRGYRVNNWTDPVLSQISQTLP